MMKELNEGYVLRYLSSVPEFSIQSEAEVLFSTTKLHLTDPSITASELSQTAGMSIDDIRNLYRNMQADPTIQAIVQSPFYSRRLMTNFARSTVRDWIADPEYASKLLQGESVMSRTLEFHATRGSCDYTCTMCLWSDKQQFTYGKRQLDSFGLMDNQNWQTVMRQAYDMGTRTIVFSGGGEPLLKRDIFELIRTARETGLKTQLYTNGFSLDRLSEDSWKEALQMEQLRISMHSPTEDIYNRIVDLPESIHALSKVSENIRELLARRQSQGGSVKVGIGFVTQTLNYSQIEQMADFASNLGVDFLDIRQDEVNITRNLHLDERIVVARQLVNIRAKALHGEFGSISVDMSDDLTALANDVEQETRVANECFMKKLRPAISPYGVVGPCDLKVEPRFAAPVTLFGNAKKETMPLIAEKMLQKQIPANCAECMPSGRTGNAIFTKLLRDFEAGIDYKDQPFNF